MFRFTFSLGPTVDIFLYIFRNIFFFLKFFFFSFKVNFSLFLSNSKFVDFNECQALSERIAPTECNETPHKAPDRDVLRRPGRSDWIDLWVYQPRWLVGWFVW